MKIAPLAAALALALLSGCGIPTAESRSPKPEAPPAKPPPKAQRPTPEAPPSAFPMTVTSADGRQVTISAAPRRIISLSPAHTETVYALGAGDRLIAADTYSDYPAEARRRR
jgi:iron complex transport system substrate-binding protein